MMAPIGAPDAIVRRLAAALGHSVHDSDAARQIETPRAAAEAIGRMTSAPI
jgi:hypothetical protein